MITETNTAEATRAADDAAADVTLLADMTTARDTAQTAVDALDNQYNDLWAQALDARDAGDDTAADAFEAQAEALHPEMDTLWATLADADAQIADVTFRNERRTGASGDEAFFDQMLAAEEAKQLEFEAKEALAVTLRTQYENATVEEKAALMKQKQQLERDEEKFRRELQQQEEERMRA